MSATETESSTYHRTIVVPTLPLTKSKTDDVDTALNDYYTARKKTASHFERNNPSFMSYSDRKDLRKQISNTTEIDLPTRTVRQAVETVRQNYEHAYETPEQIDPSPEQASSIALDAQVTRLFYHNDRYYLNLKTGSGHVSLPLRTTDDAYHSDYLPNPEALPPKSAPNQKRPGVTFDALQPDAFPEQTVSLKQSVLKRAGEREFEVHLTFERVPRQTGNDDVGETAHRVGVALGYGQLAVAALYTPETDHVSDWWVDSGDDAQHYIEHRDATTKFERQRSYEIANRVHEFAIAAPESASLLVSVNDRSSAGHWPYEMVVDSIREKVEETGVPVERVVVDNPEQCSQCGISTDRTDNREITCPDCGYTQTLGENASVLTAKQC